MRAKKTETSIRKEQITEAALHIISLEGINSLNISKIAETVGIVPSALYRHFKSKEDVVDMVIRHIGSRLVNNTAEAERETEGSLDRLESIITRHASMLEENRAIPHLVFSDALYAGNPDRKAVLNSVITGYLNKIEAVIKQGQKEKEIRNDVDSKTLSVNFLGLLLPAVVIRNVSEGKFDVSLHVKKVWKFFRESIQA